MSVQSRTLSVPPGKVWSVLADGWLFPLFVVGASRMREVDDSWPAVGARLHHSVGSWPAVVDDITRVLVCDPPHRLRLRAQGWPAGAAEVEFRLRAEGLGTVVSVEENVVSGPGRLVPKPIRDVQLMLRNTEVLKRLSYIAERRAV